MILVFVVEFISYSQVFVLYNYYMREILLQFLWIYGEIDVQGVLVSFSVVVWFFSFVCRDRGMWYNQSYYFRFRLRLRLVFFGREFFFVIKSGSFIFFLNQFYGDFYYIELFQNFLKRGRKLFRLFFCLDRAFFFDFFCRFGSVFFRGYVIGIFER